MRLRRQLGHLLILITVLLIAFSVPVYAEGSGKDGKKDKESKVVKVGWYESAFHHKDEFGRRSGYGYEYQKRVSIYTGWEYEYVDGSWPELLEKLQKGEIDLLSDVSYTEERAETILYSSESMGGEGYHIFISPGNKDIKPDDFSTLNGKKVVVNKSSIQEQMFIEWAEEHDVEPVIIETTEKTPEILKGLANGEYDALVTLDTYGNSADVVPVCKVGYADSYFGVSKKRPDLKKDLDIAMSRIIEDNRDYNQQLADKFNKASAVNSFLTADEKEWLVKHGEIRVGYMQDFLPFCDYNKDKDQLEGALDDYLNFAATCEKNAVITFKTKPYETNVKALEALENGEIDCVFPIGISAYDGEKYNAIITDPVVKSEMYVAVRSATHQGIFRDKEMTVAILRENPNSLSFLMDYFPNWEPTYYDTRNELLTAVADGSAEAGLVNNYRISRISEEMVKHKLTALPTGEAMDISFAVRKGDDCLYSILNKINRLIPETTLNASLTNHGFHDEKVTMAQFIRDNLITFIAVIALIMVLILLLVLRNIRANQKVQEGKRIISEAETDPLTGLYNWNFFLVYAGKILSEHPEEHMDAVVINIDSFHAINAMYGREFGDRVIKTLGDEIKTFLESTHGIASRFDADRFDIYCSQRTDWPDQLRKFQKGINATFSQSNIRLRMGVKPWQEGQEPIQQFDQARTACNKVRRSDVITRVLIYDAAMGAQEDREQKLMSDLSRAIDQEEFQVYYQPKYDIKKETPELSSAEALIRWNHPELGLIPPDDFIPLFERSGQIGELDKYVWAEAARQIADWRDRLGVTVPVSVNLSRLDVFDQNLSSILNGLVARNKLENGELMLEVTESAYTEDAEKLIQVIGDLRQKGFKIEMDDFGSGYSSLNMLSTMPVDVIKMDIAFIRNIEYDERDLHLVWLIMDIARYLKVPVVAEGVENGNQLKLLKEAGCDLVQGFYFSRPLPAAEFEKKVIGNKE